MNIKILINRNFKPFVVHDNTFWEKFKYAVIINKFISFVNNINT